MAKPAVYTPREQEVLDSPDYYVIRLFRQKAGWIESPIPFTAKEALTRFNNIKKLDENHRVVIYAARKLDDEIRLACVTPAHLSALVELHAAQ